MILAVIMPALSREVTLLIPDSHSIICFHSPIFLMAEAVLHLPTDLNSSSPHDLPSNMISATNLLPHIQDSLNQIRRLHISTHKQELKRTKRSVAHLFGLADLGDLHQIQNSVLLDHAALTQLSTTSRAISRALRAYSTIRLRASQDSLHIHAAIHQIQLTNFIRVLNEAIQSCLSILYFDDFSRLFRPQPIPHRYHLLGSHTDSDSLTLIIQAVTYSRYVPVQSNKSDSCTSFLTPNNRWISRQVPVPLHSTIQLSGREKYFTSSEEACRDSQLTSPPRCINHPPPAWVGTPTSLPYCTSEWYDSGSLSISSPESHSSCLQITDKSLQIQWRAFSKMPQSLELPLPISIQLDALLADSSLPSQPPTDPLPILAIIISSIAILITIASHAYINWNIYRNNLTQEVAGGS